MDKKELTIRTQISSLTFVSDIFTNINNGNYSNQYVREFMLGYKHDILAPLGVYFLTSIFTPKLNAFEKASVVFSVYSAGEIGQYLGILNGTFDPYDFLAYATGVSIGVALERFLFGSQIKAQENNNK